MAAKPEVRYINAYVSGNVAYRPEKKPQKKSTVQLPRVKRKQKIVIPVDLFALGGIVAAIVLSFMLLVGVVQLHHAQQEVAELNHYVVTMQAENKKLKDTYTSGYNLEEIRDIALAMGMVSAEQVPHVQMRMAEPEVVEEPTAWESFWTFMVGLFA